MRSCNVSGSCLPDSPWLEQRFSRSGEGVGFLLGVDVDGARWDSGERRCRGRGEILERVRRVKNSVGLWVSIALKDELMTMASTVRSWIEESRECFMLSTEPVCNVCKLSDAIGWRRYFCHFYGLHTLTLGTNPHPAPIPSQIWAKSEGVECPYILAKNLRQETWGCPQLSGSIHLNFFSTLAPENDFNGALVTKSSLLWWMTRCYRVFGSWVIAARELSRYRFRQPKILLSPRSQA